VRVEAVPDKDFAGPGALRKMRPPVKILKFIAIEDAENRDAEGIEGEEKPTKGPGGAS